MFKKQTQFGPMGKNVPALQKHNVFVSFDYDHDARLKDAIIGQSKYPNSPFNIIDFSMKEAAPQRSWRAHARRRIARSSVVLVLCGEHTHRAKGVSEEIKIARELGKPYFLIRGYSDRRCTRPAAAPRTKMHDWTWGNLRAIINTPRAFKDSRPVQPQQFFKERRMFEDGRPVRMRRRNSRGGPLI